MTTLPDLPPPEPKPDKPGEAIETTYSPIPDDDPEITWEDADNILEAINATVRIIQKSTESKKDADEEDNEK